MVGCVHPGSVFTVVVSAEPVDGLGAPIRPTVDGAPSRLAQTATVSTITTTTANPTFTSRRREEAVALLIPGMGEGELAIGGVIVIWSGGRSYVGCST